MHYRTLGRTGIKVSPYCLGAMMFGGLGNPDHDDCIRIIHKALDHGINFIDTADRYSRGESEEIVGKALKGRRDNIVLTTKVNGLMGEDANSQGNSRRWIMQAVEASLRRLQTDHIDLYLIHRPAPDTDIEETLSALTDLMRRQGAGDRILDLPGLRDRRGPMGRRAARASPFPHGTAAIFDPRSRHRARRASHLRATWNGSDGLEPIVERHAHRALPQGAEDARQPAGEIHAQANVG